ncbi:hypothetical protein R6Q59_036783 [Mikania micrantha]|uniref:Legume lectin domain-containing protein n=1 Tax=Mikania micrantha TaxID=192012 RepID=A0A5N6N8Y3_9ASTR|nr:hypothetical protein E3N88_21923 [Mikania micrantha]
MANIKIPQFLIITLFTLLLSSQFHLNISKQTATIYEILISNGLPMGLLPKGVTNFTFDDSGRFEVHLDQACNSKFENELHYDRNVSGVLTYGQINGVSGISAQDLFMWFSVKEIRVDIPSSGLIYFDVGVVHKQFSLSSFDTPRDCVVSSVSIDNQLITTVSKSLSRKFGHRKHSHEEHSMAVL